MYNLQSHLKLFYSLVQLIANNDYQWRQTLLYSGAMTGIKELSRQISVEWSHLTRGRWHVIKYLDEIFDSETKWRSIKYRKW